jgi:hypothetical protein
VLQGKIIASQLSLCNCKVRIPEQGVLRLKC